MIERLLEPDSTDTPDCSCGSVMGLLAIEPKADDISLKIFRCATCGHEMRLMVWGSAPTTGSSAL